MSKLPILRIVRIVGELFEEICDIDHSQSLLFDHTSDVIVSIEGIEVHSYEELSKVAAQDCYKDKEILQVRITPFVITGG